MPRNLLVFLQFLRRDFYQYKDRGATLFINFGVLYPILFSFFFCYVQPSIYFGTTKSQLGSVVFIGHILIVLVVLAYNLNVGLIFDLENKRFINYQITLLSPRLVLLERIVFASLFTFLVAAPFFPMSKLLMQSHFVTTNSQWLVMFIMLYVSSLCCAAYTQWAVCTIPSSRQLTKFWLRVNFMLITLGGLFIPWKTLYTFSPFLGYVGLLNPLLYITEGLRNALIGGPDFIPIWICISMLLTYTIVLTILACYCFKKRVDHI